MKTVSMSGLPRANVGKKDAKLTRQAGRVPCVVYGGSEEVHFSLDGRELQDIVFTPYTHLTSLILEGKTFNAIIQDVQYHPVTDNILHVDFLEVIPGKPVVISLPIRIEGNSVGVLRGGKLIKKYRKLKVKGLVEHMPEEVVVNISKLDINDVIKIGDIRIPEIQLLDPQNNMVVTVASTRAVEPTTPGK
jgi:large subunit ribosomal protein L25